jgi:hypothetical protein
MHKHYWYYPQVVFQGRDAERLDRDTQSNEVGVVRYCHECGKRQMAFTSAWGTVPKDYKIDDVIEEQP